MLKLIGTAHECHKWYITHYRLFTFYSCIYGKGCRWIHVWLYRLMKANRGYVLCRALVGLANTQSLNNTVLWYKWNHSGNFAISCMQVLHKPGMSIQYYYFICHSYRMHQLPGCTGITMHTHAPNRSERVGIVLEFGSMSRLCPRLPDFVAKENECTYRGIQMMNKCEQCTESMFLEVSPL